MKGYLGRTGTHAGSAHREGTTTGAWQRGEPSVPTGVGGDVLSHVAGALQRALQAEPPQTVEASEPEQAPIQEKQDPCADGQLLAGAVAQRMAIAPPAQPVVQMDKEFPGEAHVVGGTRVEDMSLDELADKKETGAPGMIGAASRELAKRVLEIRAVLSGSFNALIEYLRPGLNYDRISRQALEKLEAYAVSINEQIDAIDSLEALRSVGALLIKDIKSAARHGLSLEKDAANLFLAQADVIHHAVEPGKIDLATGAPARGRKRDAAEDVATYAGAVSDTTIGGIGGGIAGIVDATVGLGAASAAVGALGASFGSFFGIVAMGFGIWGMRKGVITAKELKKISPLINDSAILEITSYAVSQAEEKVARNALVTAIGLTALVGGILGFVALNVASFGIPAAIVGITAALAGLGTIAWKYFRSKRKRKKARIEFATTMIETARGDGEGKSEAVAKIESFGLSLDTEDATLIPQLAEKVDSIVKSKRQQVAESLIASLINGIPSEQVYAEMTINALKYSPDKIRDQVSKGDYATAVSRLMSKLSSW